MAPKIDWREGLVCSRCGIRQVDMVVTARAPIGDRDFAIEDFIEGFNQPTYRGMRINGQRVATWSSQHGWSGDSRPEADWLGSWKP
jgi:hypothetical protein